MSDEKETKYTFTSQHKSLRVPMDIPGEGRKSFTFKDGVLRLTGQEAEVFHAAVKKHASLASSIQIVDHSVGEAIVAEHRKNFVQSAAKGGLTSDASNLMASKVEAERNLALLAQANLDPEKMGKLTTSDMMPEEVTDPLADKDANEAAILAFQVEAARLAAEHDEPPVPEVKPALKLGRK